MRCSLLSISATIATAVIGTAIALPAAAQAFIVVDLGPGSAVGINKKGQVVGNNSTGAFRWSADAGFTYLQEFELGYHPIASAINTSGHIVGRVPRTITMDAVGDFGEPITISRIIDRAFIWDGVMHDLGMIGSPFVKVGNSYLSTTTQANAVNDHDQVACQTYNAPGGGAFVSYYGSGYPTFEDIMPISINSHGWLILNAPYFIKGWDPDNTGVANGWFIDDDLDGVNDLRVFLATLFGGALAYPCAVNEANQIVGAADNGQFDAFGNEIDHAVIWANEGTSLVDLGTLLGFDGSFASGINNVGQVIGGNYVTSSDEWAFGYSHPFIWDSVHGMRDLASLLPANSGWTLAHALIGEIQINDNGEIVTTATDSQGVDHAVLLRSVSGTTSSGDTITVTPSASLPLTLTFDSVTAGGTTTVTSSNSAPSLPEGFQVSGTYIDIQTTAAFTGLVDVCVPYDPSVFPYYPDGATEEEQWPGGKPRLMHYDASIAKWVNITTAINPDIHCVCGKTASFSPFAIVKQVSVSYSVAALFDQTKAYKSGSTVPAKIQLRDANGVNVSSSAITVTATGVTRISDNAPGALVDSGNSNPDNNFRYDASLSGYIFNLSLKWYATGTYRLSVKTGADPVAHTVDFQVK